MRRKDAAVLLGGSTLRVGEGERRRKGHTLQHLKDLRYEGGRGREGLVQVEGSRTLTVAVHKGVVSQIWGLHLRKC